MSETLFADIYLKKAESDQFGEPSRVRMSFRTPPAKENMLHLRLCMFEALNKGLCCWVGCCWMPSVGLQASVWTQLGLLFQVEGPLVPVTPSERAGCRAEGLSAALLVLRSPPGLHTTTRTLSCLPSSVKTSRCYKSKHFRGGTSSDSPPLKAGGQRFW